MRYRVLAILQNHPHGLIELDLFKALVAEIEDVPKFRKTLKHHLSWKMIREVGGAFFLTARGLETLNRQRRKEERIINSYNKLKENSLLTFPK